MAIPLLLLAPVAWSRAPAAHRAAVFAVFFLLFGTFGACIPLVQEGRSGWLRKVRLTGVSERRWWTERVLAETALDLVQLAPTALVYLWAMDRPLPGGIVWMTLTLSVTLLTAHLVGAIVAASVRSLGEGALGSAAVGLLLAHGAGAFRPVPGEGPGRLVGALDPVKPLVQLLRDPVGLGGVASAYPPAVAIATLLFGLSILAAPGLMERLSRFD